MNTLASVVPLASTRTAHCLIFLSVLLSSSLFRRHEDDDFPAAAPGGGTCVQRGRKEKKSLYTVVGTHCTRTRAGTFWGASRDARFTLWDTQRRQWCVCVCGEGEEPTQRAQHTTHPSSLSFFLARACARPLVHYCVFCSVFLNPTAFFFFLFPCVGENCK